MRSNQSQSVLLPKNQVKWNCTYHQSQRITNFCLSQQCLLPLCPQCVKSHQNDHYKSNTHGQFEAIDNVINGAKGQLLSGIERGQKIKQTMQIFWNNKENQLNQILFSLRQFKEEFLRIISEKFNTLEQQIRKTVKSQNEAYQNQADSTQLLLNNLMQNSQKTLQSLSTTNGIHAIIHTFKQLRTKSVALDESFKNIQKSMIKHEATIDRDCLRKVIDQIGESIEITTSELPRGELLSSILMATKKDNTKTNKTNINCLSIISTNSKQLSQKQFQPTSMINKLSRTTQKIQNQLNTLKKTSENY